MPLVVEVELSGPNRVQVPMKAPHAAIAARIDIAHHAAAKPFAIAPPCDIRGGVAMRVGVLHDALAEDLARSLETDPRVRLGAHRFTYTGLRVAEQLSWAEMVTITQQQRWDVEFRTPTTFRRGGRTSPWPDPAAIARSLMARWDAIHPGSSVRLDPRLARSVWVLDISGRSVVVRVLTRRCPGFLAGSATWGIWRTDPQHFSNCYCDSPGSPVSDPSPPSDSGRSRCAAFVISAVLYRGGSPGLGKPDNFRPRRRVPSRPRRSRPLGRGPRGWTTVG